MIIPDQFNCWCLFSFKIQAAIFYFDTLGKCVIIRNISPNVRSKLSELIVVKFAYFKSIVQSMIELEI